jgi:hypothetical protein
METASVGKSLNVVRQAALQLSAIAGNTGIGGMFGGGSNRLNEIVGNDLNSLVTVGRVSDHTLRVRIGAKQLGNSTFAMVPSTHNVSVVVFTRTSNSTKAKHISEIAAIVKAELFDVRGDTVNDGVVTHAKLETSRDSPVDLTDQVKRQLNTYRYSVSPECRHSQVPELDVVSALDRGDYKAVGDCLVDNDSGANVNALKPSGASELRLRRLLAALMTVQVETRYSKLLIELSPYRAFKLPRPDQIVYAADNGKTLSVTIRGGSNIRKDHLTAVMRPAPAASAAASAASAPRERMPAVMLATKVAADDDGTVQLEFPSTKNVPAFSPPPESTKPAAKPAKKQKKNKQEPATKSDSKPDFKAKEVVVVLRQTADEDSGASGTARYRIYVNDTEKAPAEPTTNPVTANTRTIVASAAGAGKVQLMVGGGDKDKTFVLTVDGADIDGDPKWDAKSGGYVVNAKTAVTLSLVNLSGLNPVKIATQTADGSALGDPLVFHVERARAQRP